MVEIERDLDTRGLNCPLPILKTKKTMREMGSGGVLRVTSSDPSSVKDFEAFCDQSGNELIDSSQEGHDFIFVIKKH
ncbi:MAG: sulfurtransferase TusA family protein [Gammaproteobacteria bacterium]|nr:sulfurtransferase TusA family protein [Gammaproteobacteria bacterium]